MTKYKDISIIGSGSFGEVRICERDSDGRRFAKKTLTDLAPEAIARFSREVRLLGSLDHPNVVQVISQRLNDVPYYYVMPLYQQSLASLVRQLATEPDRVEGIFGRILDGVAYAHEQGVIHRDLKPMNILLNDDADLVVSDFGLGRQLNSKSTRQTGTGYQMGTELYMAPEQFSDSKSVDERCDVFGLGRMMIELYAGFLSPGTQDLACIPPRFLPIFRRATHYDPNKRFTSAVEMRAAWLQAVAASARADGKPSLQAMIAQFAAESSDAELSVDELVKLLLACADDPDEIHASIMKLPPEIVALACNHFPDDMLAVLTVFAEFLEKQGWGFDYTDTLADKCVAICEQTENGEIKARLAVAVAIVGADHNRWYVMGRAAHLLEQAAEGDEEDGFVDLFAGVADSTRQRIAGYATLSKIPNKLRLLFDFDDEK